MEKSSNCRVRGSNRIEANTMAILDSIGVKDARDNIDDMMAFLEAVRSSSLVPDHGTVPTSKMFKAIVQILKTGKSLELIMASYQLLIELDKCFPRVYLCNVEETDPMGSSTVKLDVVDEAWSPFVVGFDIAYTDEGAADGNSSGPFDPAGFETLIQDIAALAKEASFQASNRKFLGKLLILHYLIYILERDFTPRNIVYKETMNWTVLRESLLNMLLGSRRIKYKGLVKNCLSIMVEICNDCEMSSAENSSEKLENVDTAVRNALPELQKGTCIAVQKLLILIMELDISRKQADLQGSITRADGVRTPVADIVLDELMYDKDIPSPFLQVFDEPKWKLEIILQYFWKYTTKPLVQTRRSNGSTDCETFHGVLKFFSNAAVTGTTLKKINVEVAQLLLAHGFQAYLSLSLQEHSNISNSTEKVDGSSLAKLCEDLISAFRNLKSTDEYLEILPVGKEALFAAATILSNKS